MRLIDFFPFAMILSLLLGLVFMSWSVIGWLLLGLYFFAFTPFIKVLFPIVWIGLWGVVWLDYIRAVSKIFTVHHSLIGLITILITALFLAALQFVCMWAGLGMRYVNPNEENPENEHHEKKENAFNDSDGSPAIELNPYQVLSVDESATLEEIKAGYQKQMSLFHPDKVQHLGKDFQQIAHEKSIEIRSAYEQVLSSLSSPSFEK